jgi:hypothetical protein
MIAEDILREVHESASEWLEMSDNPDAMVSGILANRIVMLVDYIKYLEKRLEYDTSSR